MFLKRKLIIALGIGLAVAQACRYQNDLVRDLTLTHEISPQPPRVGPATITLRVADTAGKPLTGLRIKLEGNMSHAGMSPVFAVAKETGSGQYSSTTELSMAGDWHFMVHIVLPDDREVVRQFEIKGVAQP